VAKKASALGHFGLLFGLLAVIFELNQIAIESSRTSGDAASAFYTAVIVWVVAVALVVVEWFQTPSSP
jgi:hypothetical protein